MQCQLATPEGTMLPENSAVDFVVSTGKGQVEVPDLTGLTVDKAEQALKVVGLALGKQTEADSTQQRKGRVISSSPGAGESVTKDTKVDIEVASGKVAVPNVVGQTLDEFIQLQERGYIDATLSHCGGSREKAASMLGISMATLYRKVEPKNKK